MPSEEDSDEDIVSLPFKVSYALSIHKAQGLEFDNVAIIINETDSEKINHNIFYTAVTRARSTLKIYWSPETQNKVINNFQNETDHTVKNIDILKSNGKIN
ncbi:hypothetical protein GCM10009794_18600 [Rothia terrae]|uniref:ATP-binding domain-containing protein n=1 Tax=Rothia terrae TaxID=396015 RepID=UPI0031D54114